MGRVTPFSNVVIRCKMRLAMNADNLTEPSIYLRQSTKPDVACIKNSVENDMDQILIIKVISALLYPLGFAFILLLIAFIVGTFRWKKTSVFFKVSSLIILLLATNPIVASKLILSLEQQYPQKHLSEIEKHDAIIVLGGGLRIPIKPALYTQIGFGSDRYWHAARLFKAGKAKQIILIGGNVYKQAGYKGEAFYASELLQQWGVPASAIAIETSSRNTEQNFNNTANYFNTKGIKSVILITSAYHMPRSLNIFKQLQIKVTPASADVLIRQQSSPQIFKYLPSTGALTLTTIAAHEYYGMWFSSLKAWIVKG